ncbi:MAG: hypothetical protein ABUT20_63565, partial [Bacteroidota bacterium]
MQQSAYKSARDGKGWMTIALHVLIWLIVFLIPYIFSADVKRGSPHKNSDQNEFLYLNTIINFFLVGLFYLNAGLLIPRFIYKRKTALYILALLGMFCMMILLDNILFRIIIIS